MLKPDFIVEEDIKSFMLEEVRSLLSEYRTSNNKDILLKLLEMFGFNLGSNYDNNNLCLSIVGNIIEVIDLEYDSKYYIIFEADIVSTTHSFECYQIEKEYLYDNLLKPISETFLIILNKDEKILYTDEIKIDKRLRTLKKIVTYGGVDLVVFEKDLESLLNSPNVNSIITLTNNGQVNNKKTYTNTIENCFIFSNIKFDSNINIVTSLINYFSNKKENSVVEYSLEEDENGPYIASKEIVNTTTSKISISINRDNVKTKVFITKNGEVIQIKFSESITDKKRNRERALISLNSNNFFDIKDIDIIIEYFTDIVKENPIIIEELKQIKYALVTNAVYKKGISDRIDTYFDEHKDDSFEKFAFDLYSNVDLLNSRINDIIYKNGQNMKLELKDPQIKQ